MPSNNRRRRQSPIRAFFSNKKRASGTIAAGAAGGVAVLPEFSLNPAAHIAILFTAIILGCYVYFRSQDDPNEISKEEANKETMDEFIMAPPARPTKPALIARSAHTEVRRLRVLVRDTIVTIVVS